MKEQLITFDTAKLAKEKGFKEYCRRLYVLDEQKENDNIGKVHYRTETYFSNSNHANKEFVSAPTQSLLQKWLREVHNIDIYIYPMYDINGTTYEININRSFYTHGKTEPFNKSGFKTYEEALEKGLEEVLKLIK